MESLGWINENEIAFPASKVSPALPPNDDNYSVLICKEAERGAMEFFMVGDFNSVFLAEAAA